MWLGIIEFSLNNQRRWWPLLQWRIGYWVYEQAKFTGVTKKTKRNRAEEQRDKRSVEKTGRLGVKNGGYVWEDAKNPPTLRITWGGISIKGNLNGCRDKKIEQGGVETTLIN